MEIKIEVGEERFKEVLEKELEAFTKEELHNICREALVRQMSDPGVFQSLFVEDRADRWSTQTKYYAKDLLVEAAKQVSFEDTFKEMQDKIVEYIKAHYNDILHDIVSNMFLNGISNYLSYNDAFKERIREEVWRIHQPSN